MDTACPTENNLYGEKERNVDKPIRLVWEFKKSCSFKILVVEPKTVGALETSIKLLMSTGGR